jgi:hypothetical protein
VKIKTVIIEVDGGVATPVEIPKGIRVIIKDRDTDGSDRRLYKDKQGTYARGIYS